MNLPNRRMHKVAGTVLVFERLVVILFVEYRQTGIGPIRDMAN
jgi:hypothetical protein